MSFADLTDNHLKIDQYPAIGHIINREGLWMKNNIGRQCQGYTDAGLAWERPYTSYLYFGGELSMPPAPPDLNIRHCGRDLLIRAKEISPEIEVIRIMLDSQSRGWTYLDIPGENYLNNPQGKLGRWDFTRNEILTGITLPHNGSSDRVYLNAFALDRHLCMNPQIYVWPGHELVCNLG